jgi:hypothetical protein
VPDFGANWEQTLPEACQIFRSTQRQRRLTRATPDEWLTTAALSFIGAGIILHVGIGLRWPFAHQTMQENP